MTRYLHTMIRVTDPDKTIAFFELLGLKEMPLIQQLLEYLFRPQHQVLGEQS